MYKKDQPELDTFTLLNPGFDIMPGQDSDKQNPVTQLQDVNDPKSSG
ncbi:hypothetical protein [Lentibacillus cibarius]|nr:hypothetical protein [Lentibacillus cibarius]